MSDQQQKLMFAGYEAEPQNRLPKFQEGCLPEEPRLNKTAFKLAAILLGLGAVLDHFALMPYIDPANFFLLPPLTVTFYTLIPHKKTESNKILRNALLAAYGLCLSLIIATSAIFLMPVWDMVLHIIYPMVQGGKGFDSTTIVWLIVWVIILVFGHRLKKIKKKMIEER